MLRTFLFSTLLFFSLVLNAQVLKERRVYYLDCSFSLVTAGIWNDVRENLKNAIDNVSDETTELIVVPFALDGKGSICTWKEMATDAGKKVLKANIDGISPKNSSMTYHSIPWRDFYGKVDPAKVTYLFFMTDGQNEEKPDPMPSEMRKWGERYGGKNVYGFYVMLHNAAKNNEIERIADEQPHLWKVETASIDIRLIRLATRAKFNVRNDKYIDIPITGDMSGLKFDCKMDSHCSYKIDKTVQNNGKLRVYIKGTKPIAQLPTEENCKIKVTMTGGNKFTFLVTESVDVKCVNEKEYSLKVSVR